MSLTEGLCAQLELLPFHCVLERRQGRTPSSAAIHAYMEALANTIPLRRALLRAAAALSGAGVRAIVYKGQDYLHRIYGELGGRAMADVDLLVPEAELGRAEAALLGAGFVPDRSCKLMHERRFCRDGVAIDLHHALLQPARMTVVHAELFARAEPCAFARGLFVLEATDALLVHCVNQTVKGYFLPPSSYLELQALLAAADLESAVARARRWQAQSALYCSLEVLGRLGHRVARFAAGRIALSARRKQLLNAVIADFALSSLLREQPSRAAMLARKTTLIDDPKAALRFVPTWFGWQLPWKAPRPLLDVGETAQAPPWQTSKTSTERAESSCARWSTPPRSS
ncbi:MAG TPA: nucleotidyltransferase family protein [Polyangiales bacterium]|nr:nucleotidyltransferase family protein [Polyangiales bacterium]